MSCSPWLQGCDLGEDAGSSVRARVLAGPGPVCERPLARLICRARGGVGRSSAGSGPSHERASPWPSQGSSAAWLTAHHARALGRQGRRPGVSGTPACCSCRPTVASPRYVPQQFVPCRLQPTFLSLLQGQGQPAGGVPLCCLRDPPRPGRRGWWRGAHSRCSGRCSREEGKGEAEKGGTRRAQPQQEEQAAGELRGGAP